MQVSIDDWNFSGKSTLARCIQVDFLADDLKLPHFQRDIVDFESRRDSICSESRIQIDPNG